MLPFNIKKSTLKIVVIINVLLLLISSCVGCTSTDSVSNGYRNVNGGVLASSKIAENSNYELLWDANAKGVLLKSKKNEQIWSDIIYDAFLDGDTSVNVNSPISLTVINNRTLKMTTFKSAMEIPYKGQVVTKITPNGIRVTYFFDTYKIAIPIEYELRENSLLVSLEPSNILEDGNEYKLVSVGITPNFCSVKNDAEDGQILIPIGSGAIMNTAETPEGTRTFSGEVYGEDATRQVLEDFANDEAIKFPVFGVSGENKGMFAIIESGSGSAVIEAEAGNDTVGYSTVGATFNIRGYDTFRFDSNGTGEEITKRVNDDIAPNKMSIAFYPMSGENTNYQGMAKFYRQYLVSSKKLDVKITDVSSYGVTLLGGINVTKSFLGIPYQNLVSLTTFSEAEKIISDLQKQTKVIPNVCLSGYGDSGIESGTIIGGKKYPKVYGNSEDIKSLQNLFRDTNASMFFDSEIVRFSKTGAGFSKTSNVAQTAIKKRIAHTLLNPVRDAKNETTYYILSRNKLFEASQAAVKKAEKYGYNSISFSSLGSIAYSDYKDSSLQYSAKYNMDEDVYSIINTVKKSGYSVATSNANSYAAFASDMLFDTPYENGYYNAFDSTVPFYQMVLHGYRPMYSEAVNLAANPSAATAKAVAFGMGVGYSLTYNYISEFSNIDVHKLYGTVYEDNRDLIINTISDPNYLEIYNSVKNAEMISYTEKAGFSVTKYDNGIEVYVNHTDDEIDSPIGKLKSYGYMMKKG